MEQTAEQVASTQGASMTLCCVWSAHGRLTPCSLPGSDRQGELVERDRHPLVHRLLDRELVVPASQIVDKAMPGDHDPGAAILLEPRIGPSRAFSRP
jgi:hypothetical protein